MYNVHNLMLVYVECMYTVCTLYVHCMYTVCTLYVHCMYTVCTLYVHCMYTVCTLYVHCMYTVFTLYVHCMYTVFTLYVQFILGQSQSRLEIMLYYYLYVNCPCSPCIFMCGKFLLCIYCKFVHFFVHNHLPWHKISTVFV